MAQCQRTRKRPRGTPPSNQSISISFTPEELQFLVEALRDLPIRGTPDSLSQMLPLIQGVRLKFASALATAIGDAPEGPTPISPTQEKDEASNEGTPPAE